MNIKIITEPITRAEALEIGKEFYTEMVKGVVDLERGVIALGGEYHMDANEVLIGDGSKQEMVWGFNVYPSIFDESWIEYTSLINIRPQVHNRGMEVESPEIREMMRDVITKLII